MIHINCIMLRRKKLIAENRLVFCYSFNKGNYNIESKLICLLAYLAEDMYKSKEHFYQLAQDMFKNA